MTLAFDVQSGDDHALTDEELAFDYDELFDEEDFKAMGIDPAQPTPAKPGSEEKVVMLAARYASGLPLWHGHDCYDHAPGQIEGEDGRVSLLGLEEDE